MTQRALSLHQPWASLVALGAKTIETRSWNAPASAIGGQLLIHAAKRKPGTMRLDDWWCEPTWGTECGLLNEAGEPHRLPLGAVVGSAVLADCVPIGGPMSFSTGIVEGETPDTAGMDVIVHHPSYGNFMGESLVLDRWHGGVEDITDQLPFGEFSPGFYAWLLEDVKPTTERCPRCWGAWEQHHIITRPSTVTTPWSVLDEREDWSPATNPAEDPPGPPGRPRRRVPCATCSGTGTCEPVRMRGRPGLWTPTWEATG